MDVYMIRHGQSTANLDMTHSGWSPVSLTEKGRRQAEETRDIISHIQFDKLFVSDVLRAQQTAEIIFPNTPRTFTALTRELDNTTMKGKTKDEMYALYGELYIECRSNFSYAPLGIDCESLEHLAARAAAFFKYLEGFSHLKRVAAVSHAGFIMSMAAHTLGIEKHPRPLMCENASVSVFRLNEWGWRVRAWNITPDVINPL